MQTIPQGPNPAEAQNLNSQLQNPLQISEQPNAPSHDEVQKKLHTKLNTFMAARGLYKAVVRNIPIFLSKEEFFLGLNVSLPVNQWYFVHGGSQTPSMVALLAYSMS
jgi:hypothetical protein